MRDLTELLHILSAALMVFRAFVPLFWGCFKLFKKNIKKSEIKWYARELK